MPLTTASEVADFFLNFAHEHGDLVTNLKLQKLVYYAQAWHLALHGTPLFGDRIQGWVHGPVVSSLYGKFKKHRWDAIPGNQARPTLSQAVQRHLTDVYTVFNPYTAYQLECMTHQETPWQNSRIGLAPDENGDREISHADMKAFYGKLARSK